MHELKRLHVVHEIEAGLADAAWASNGEQAHVGMTQELAQSRRLLLAPEKRRERGRQVRLRRGVAWAIR